MILYHGTTLEIRKPLILRSAFSDCSGKSKNSLRVKRRFFPPFGMRFPVDFSEAL